MYKALGLMVVGFICTDSGGGMDGLVKWVGSNSWFAIADIVSGSDSSYYNVMLTAHDCR